MNNLIFQGVLEVSPGGRDGRTWYKVTASGRVFSPGGDFIMNVLYFEYYTSVEIPSGEYPSLPCRLAVRLDRKIGRPVIELRFD